MRLKFIATLAILSLIGSPSMASVRDMSPDSELRWSIEESYGDSLSQAVISTQDAQGFWREAAYCQEFGEGKLARWPEGASCNPADYKTDILIQFSVLQAPFCEPNGRNCLEAVFATGPDGTKVEGKFLGYVNPDSEIPANEALGNPRGVSSGVWQIPGVTNSAGTDLYEVHVNMEGGLVSFKKGVQEGKFSLKNREFNAGIRPVRATISAEGVEKQRDCADCNSLPSNYNFGISVILPESVKNWYSGRIQSADVIYKKVDTDYFRITITGKPLRIPTFTGSVKRGAAGEKLLKEFHWCESSWTLCFGVYTNGYGNENNWTDFLEAWRPVAKDSATGEATVWTIRTVPVYFGPKGDAGFYSCTPKNRAAGIVSTNSLMYNGNIPVFDRGFFNYRVAGMHFEADGKTEFLGRYEMVMDEQLARCMFKFPKAPISATVTVSEKNGDTSVATSMVSSRNGKLRLAAYNFTFSEKTIQIKMNAVGHLTCTKGKQVRYVKGKKCPAGFKRG